MRPRTLAALASHERGADLEAVLSGMRSGASYAAAIAAVYGGAVVEVEHTDAWPVVRSMRPAYPPSNSVGALRTQGTHVKNSAGAE